MVNVICLANDTLVVTSENDIPMLEWKVNTPMEAMTCWIELAGLNLATAKTVVVLFTHRHRFHPPSFRLKREQIRLCTDLKYLGLWFDGKLTLKEHVEQTAAKDERIIANISQLTSNLGGLSEGKWKLLANVAMLVLLYEAPIVANAINTRQYQRTEMVSVQQEAALRCVSSYCTVSTEAVCVLAAIPPIEIVADKRRRVYSTTCRVKPKSAKALLVRHKERQVMFHK